MANWTLRLPEWLHLGVTRRGGYEISSTDLALHFAQHPTPEMVRHVDDPKETGES